jgi:hypothetical protein
VLRGALFERPGVSGDGRPHFEECARDWVRRADEEIRGGAGAVAATVVNDRAGRARHEIDVIGLDRGGSGGRAGVRLLGEAKATPTRRGPADLDRLERLKTLLHDRGHDTAGARLMIFSVAGFHPELTAIAGRRADVHLIDLPALLRGHPKP